MIKQEFLPLAAGAERPAALQVAGVGLSMDQTPAWDLWAKVQAAGHKRIPPPEENAGTLRNCLRMAEQARADVLRGALRHWPAEGATTQTFVENFPMICHGFAPRRHDRSVEFGDWARRHLDDWRHAMCNRAGLDFHKFNAKCSFVTASERNDSLWASDVFKAFDTNGDLNSVLLMAQDGYAMRSEVGGWQNRHAESLQSILSRDKISVDRSDAFACLLLLHPPAARWLEELSHGMFDRSVCTTLADGRKARTPYGFHSYAKINGGRAGAFRPTEHVEELWSAPQVRQYDGMPALAWLYRPHSLHYLDESKVLRPLAERRDLLQAALQATLQVDFRGATPQRIFFDAGADEAAAARTALFREALAAAWPKFDLQDPNAGYDLTQRLGDTGATSLLAGVGLASLAAWETSGTALVANLRRDDGATLLAVRPSGAKYRQQFGKRPYEAT